MTNNDDIAPENVQELPEGRVFDFLNRLLGAVLQTIYGKNPELARMWFETTQAAGGWFFAEPGPDGWRDVLVDGTHFARISFTADGVWLCRVVIDGVTHELEIHPVPYSGGES